jgi:hypothetical protein
VFKYTAAANNNNNNNNNNSSRTALGPTRPPILWIPGALSLGVKRPERETDHSPPFSAEVKYAWSYASTPQYVFIAWCLDKHRDNFTFLTLPLIIIIIISILLLLLLLLLIIIIKI